MSEINSNPIQSSIKTISTLNKLIDSLKVNCFESKTDEQVFDSKFLSPDFDVFLTLVNGLTQISDDCYKRDKLLSLLTNYIYSNDILESLLLKTCHSKCDGFEIIGQKLETILVSLPELISNVMKKNCHEFDRNVYIKRIVSVIHSCVVHVFESVNSGVDSSLQFLSTLSGRIAFNGFSVIVWNQLIEKLINNCEKDFVWRRIVYRLIVVNQKDQYCEPILKTIFCFATNYEKIVWIIGKAVETKAKIKFLIVNKFLLINHFESDQILINIFGYLFQSSEKLFFESFYNVLNAWSNSSAIKYRSHSQHLYLSRALMIGSRLMKNINYTEFQDKFCKLTMNGIEIHLKNSQSDFRNVGLTVGRNLLTLFCPDSNEIEFEMEENDDIKHLNNLFNNETIQPIVDKVIEEIPVNKEVTEVPKKRNPELDSDDDDDDLIPYDMSNDIPIDSAKRPVYLRDCMQGLIENEKPEWFEKCLINAENIIRSNSDTVEEVAVEFIRILHNLEDNCAVTDFIGLRLRSMIALCVCSPKSVATYLSSQFYEQNYTMRHRLDILEVFVSSSQELSTNIPNTNICENLQLLSHKEVFLTENHWKDIIENRIKAKTKILTNKTKVTKNEAFVNRFAQFAGYFFFPLLRNISGNEIKLDLAEEDHYVLGRLLYTLGIMMKNVSLTPISRQMGKELLDFMLSLRYHSEVYVREALIFDFCMIITSVSPVYLIDELSMQIVECQLWLKDISENDANSQCVQKAFTALHLLKEIAKQMPLSLNTNENKQNSIFKI